MNANKEKESMVMKYALNEREIIIQKKHREESEKKMKNALKERDDAVNKSKNAIAEKLKLQQLADSRVSKHFQDRDVGIGSVKDLLGYGRNTKVNLILYHLGAKKGDQNYAPWVFFFSKPFYNLKKDPTRV